MRKLILIAVIFQLAITLTDEAKLPIDKLKFGDIISFYRYCVSQKLSYKHYAIYVGKGPDMGQSERNIFHRTSIKTFNPPGFSTCAFGSLENEENKHGTLEVKVDNYLDGIDGIKVLPEEEMSKLILELLKSPGVYHPLSNNCEHMVTHVRYNLPISLQKDTYASHLCNDNKELCKKVEAKVKEIRDSTKVEYECAAKEDTPKKPN